MLARLILLFVVTPVVELWLLLRIGAAIGVPLTLALVFGTGVVGATLARSQGVRAFRDFQRSLAEGRVPGQALLDGVCVLVGGAFLLTPGLLTDLLGFSLVLPPTRKLIQRRIKRRVEEGIEAGSIQAVVIATTPHPSGRDGEVARGPDA